MKARIKGEAKWKDYKIVFDSDGTFLGLETAGYYEGEPRRYVSEILPLECFDLWSEPDWNAYHREVAKAALQGLLASPRSSRNLYVTDQALRYADELIEQLKNTENTNDS